MIMEKVLVTGGLGFIGTALSKKLLEKGFEVICIDNFSGTYSNENYQSNKKLLESKGKVTIINSSTLSKETFNSLKGKGITRIVHLGAKTGVRHSVQNPKEYIETNVIGSMNVMEFASQEKIKHLVLASTSSVYGKNKIPFVETMSTLEPLSPYAASKVAMEHLAYAYYNTKKLPVTLLRFFTV